MWGQNVARDMDRYSVNVHKVQKDSSVAAMFEFDDNALRP
jgi:hypothetical protein